MSKHVYRFDAYYASFISVVNKYFLLGKNKEKELTSEIKVTSFGNRAL